MQRIILGCGSSFGVPSAVGHWGLCDPKEPKNNRTRTSLAIASDAGVWLIDASPDLRAQMLRENIILGAWMISGVFRLRKDKRFPSIPMKKPASIFNNAMHTLIF